MSTIEEEPAMLSLDTENLPSDQTPSLQVVCVQTVILEKDTNDNAVEVKHDAEDAIEVKHDTDDAVVSNEMKDLSVTPVSGNEQAVNQENEDEVIILDSPDSSIGAGVKKGIQDNHADIVVKGEDEEDSPEKGKHFKTKGWRYLDDDEEEQLGLLEKSVIIEGKRRRSTVDRLKIGTPASTKPKFNKGSGTPLSEESHFTSVVMKHFAEELKPLHRLLYGNPGKLTTIKRDVRKFNGFSFAKNSAEYEKRHKMILNLKTREYALIQNAFHEFYCPKDKKNKEDYATHLLDILMAPPKIDSQDFKTPKRGSSKTPSSTHSKKRQSSGSTEPEAKRSKKSKKNTKRDKSEKDGPSIGDDVNVDTSHGSQQTAPDNFGKNDGPSREELTLACSNIIKDADLDEMTTKQVIEAVALIYPDMNVEKRRTEIKGIVKDVVLNLVEPSESS